jgi:Tfp pilus assembly protein PilZ
MWSDDWDSVFLMNISAGGIFFYYTKDLGIGTLLDLKIYVPNAVLVINCVGKVIRIDKPRHHTSMFGIAIKFTEIGEQEKEIINTTVQEFLEYKIKNF